MNQTQMIYILDDDAAVRKSIGWMLELNGLPYRAFESPAEFLVQVRPDCPSCLILDLHLPGITGIEVLRQIRNRSELAMPVIVLAGTGTIAMAVDCMKSGATEFLEKPLNPDLLLSKLRESLAADAINRQKAAAQHSLKQRVDLLTRREKEILRLLCEGKSTKQMAADLSISIKTVSIHRWHLMKKMQVGSATEAVRFAFDANAA